MFACFYWRGFARYNARGGDSKDKRMSLLKVESLSVEVNGFCLKNINFCLKEGEFLGIVGESGSGKTLLSHLILRLVKEYNLQSGKIECLGRIF